MRINSAGALKRTTRLSLCILSSMGDSEHRHATKRQRKSDDSSGSPGVEAAQAFLGSTPLSAVANKHQKVLRHYGLHF